MSYIHDRVQNLLLIRLDRHQHAAPNQFLKLEVLAVGAEVGPQLVGLHGLPVEGHLVDRRVEQQQVDESSLVFLRVEMHQSLRVSRQVVHQNKNLIPKTFVLQSVSVLHNLLEENLDIQDYVLA